MNRMTLVGEAEESFQGNPMNKPHVTLGSFWRLVGSFTPHELVWNSFSDKGERRSQVLWRTINWEL